MNSKLTNYQTYIIDVLRYVCDFFERNNIRYFLAYGTMLGAVRHHGIIPWDDDADVFVPREDYERLLKMQGQLQTEGYDIISMESDNSYLTYAKIYDNNTSLWEVKQFPKMIGVFVDIFPLDYSNEPYEDVVNNVKRFSSLSRNFALAKSVYDIHDFFSYLKGFHIKTAWLVVKSFFYRKKKNYYDRVMKEYYRQLQQTSGKYFIDYSSSVNVSKPGSVIYESVWFDDYVMLQFEDFQARVPVGYDEYLKCRYGDYMQFPPESERVPGHSHYFLDLQTHHEMEEIKKNRVTEI